MLGDHFGGVLNGVARLLVGASLLQDMGRKHVTDVMRTVREQPLDRASSGIGVIYAVALNGVTPGLVETGCVIGRVGAGRLDRLDEERSGIRGGP